MRELTDRYLCEHIASLEKKEYSSRELTEAYLERIESVNGDINAFVTLCGERALAEAKRADERIARGERLSALDGIPYAAKDNICAEGVRLSCGSKIFADYISPYDATVIATLKEKGAILLGKTNLDEFAMGTGCETSCFGRTKNPHAPERVAGGSSGGSAAAVAAGMAPFALGSDTGGSVRQPAAFCGVVGMRPTYSLLSRYGLVGFAPSLDTVGILAKDARDCATVFENIAKYDPKDATSGALLNTEPIKEVAGMRVALVKEATRIDCSGEVLRALERSAECIAALGAEIVEISLPSFERAYASYYTISSAEASSNLSRFDGVRYGYRADTAKSLDQLYTLSRSEGFGQEVKRRILFGALALSKGFKSEIYERALIAREEIRRELDSALVGIDALLLPTSSSPAYRAGERKNELFDAYTKDDLLCAPASLAGLPAISLPYTQKGALPVGVQLVCGRYRDREMLELSRLVMSEMSDGGERND